MSRDSSPGAAITAFEAGQPVAALEAMLEAWRKSRSSALAELIERVSEKLARPLPKLKRDNLQGNWKTTFARRQLAELPVLLDVWSTGNSPQVRQRLDLLRELPADPRMTEPLLDWGRQSWTTGATSATQKVWTGVLLLAVDQQDPRMRAGLEAILTEMAPRQADLYGVDVVVGRVTKAIAKLPVAGEKLDLTRLEAAVRAFEDGPAVSRAQALPEKTGLRLDVRDSIYENPDDDGPISVWADLLLEAGDPMGTFVSLQLQAERKPLTKANQAELKRLQKANVARLLGPLAAVVEPGTAAFRRGLLYRARVSMRTKEQRDAFSEHPYWRSVRQVHTTTPHLRSACLEQVERFGMRLVPAEPGGLKGPEGFERTGDPVPPWSQLLELARGQKPLNLRAISVATPRGVPVNADVEPLGERRGLPNLEELHLVASSDYALRRLEVVERLGALAKHPFVREIQHLVLEGYDDPWRPALGDVQAAWAALRSEGQVLSWMSSHEWYLRIEQRDGGLHVIATTDGKGSFVMGKLVTLLGEIRALASITVHAPAQDAGVVGKLEKSLSACRKVVPPPTRRSR
ncbi:MAG: hypothetical protein R3F61_33155 [Myxococcota bacterium]